jgi:hypothetical protein
VIDLVTDGDLRNGLPLGDLDGLYLEAVTSGAGKLVVTAETLVRR